MGESFAPASEAELVATLAWAAAEGAALELVGHGSKRALGRPMEATRRLDLSRLRGVGLYEPEELVLTAGPGTPLIEIEALLAQRGQELAFEPGQWGPLLGADRAASLGGVIACNLAGPRRIKAGAARDHFLGCRAVSGRGEAFKAGGRVVKNVTGYDVCKLLAGSYGTLAALSEVTLKVMPRAEKTRTVLLFGLDDTAACQAMSTAIGSPHDVSGLAHLPAAIAKRSGVGYVAAAGAAVTALRVEGPLPSVAYRCRGLRDMLGGAHAVEELHSMNSIRLWNEIRDIAYLAEAGPAIVWRLSLPPLAGAAVMAEIARTLAAEQVAPEYFFDWAGGLVWLGLPLAADGWEKAVRRAVARAGGHATLMRAPADLRARSAVFAPEDTGLAALTRRVKHSFDPAGILNPGRMWVGV